MQQPAAQPHAVLEENMGRPVSSSGAGRAQPGDGLGAWAHSQPPREQQRLREPGTVGAALPQPSPEPQPLEKGPPPPGFGQEEEEEEEGETRKRKKIQLSPLEKLKLSTLRLTLDSETQSQGGPGRRLAGSEPLQSAAPARAQVSWAEPECSEEEEDGEETETETETETESDGEEEQSQDLGYFRENCFLTVGEKETYPTWKRTLTRRAREAEMKRFCKAQSIQRRLEEIEVKFRELERKGIELERSLRSEGGDQSELKSQWMNQLLSLVQKKNSLVSEESDLMIAAQELKLEEQQWRLDQELRRYMNMEETLKMPQDQQAEKEILGQLLEVVNKRNELIQLLEEKRLTELSEALPGTVHGCAA